METALKRSTIDMGHWTLGPQYQEALCDVLGYLNFSSGTSDPKFWQNIDLLFRHVLSEKDPDYPTSLALKDLLTQHANKLHQETDVFADIRQATTVLGLVFDQLLPAYRNFHRDLLLHQTDDDLWRPFFLAKAVEAVLATGACRHEESIVKTALHQLNDYIGYRPVAILENEQQMEPYGHEWVCAIPLYRDGVGIATDRYAAIVELAIDILRQTDPDLLSQAFFDPTLLSELAVDPRILDFSHPANNRPNHHFGGWDPHHIDLRGTYRRFVLQQVTLDALLSRIQQRNDLPRETLLFEAATVLAGTILMASGLSGSGPDSHDSSTTLATLVRHIAAYRDHFYQDVFERADPAHQQHLKAELLRFRKPFSGARQHLNQELACRRATQIQRAHLARIYARMGRADAALREAHQIKVPGPRIVTQMTCYDLEGHRDIDSGKLDRVPKILRNTKILMDRGIQCGALIDPWNIVGFGGNFSLFPAPENSVHDPRVEQLILLIDKAFQLCGRAWIEAAAVGNEGLVETLAEIHGHLASWWDQFATTTVSDIPHLSGQKATRSAKQVAQSLGAWHQAGEAVEDTAFWKSVVGQFDSSKAFAIVIEKLLEKQDYVASMALMMQWISQANQVGLEEGSASFHRLAFRWLHSVQSACVDSGPQDFWALIQKFFVLLEANTDDLCQFTTPFDRNRSSEKKPSAEDQSHFSVDENVSDLYGEAHLYRAAYEDMVYRDSTDDGVEGDLLSGNNSSDYELREMYQRFRQPLKLMSTLADLWKEALLGRRCPEGPTEKEREVFQQWQQHATSNLERLRQLVDLVFHHRIPISLGTQEANLNYDRHRMVKEMLLERILTASVDTRDAQFFLNAVLTPRPLPNDIPTTTATFIALLAGKQRCMQKLWPKLLDGLAHHEFHYVPISRGGLPQHLLEAKCTLRLTQHLLRWLPRLGLLRKTGQLLTLVQNLETTSPLSRDSISEYDRLFEIGYSSIVRSVVYSAESQEARKGHKRSTHRVPDEDLVHYLEQLTGVFMERWVRHSRRLRLSAVEPVLENASWTPFVAFVEKYGRELFTQDFLHPGNLRAILHLGVDRWLHSQQTNPDPHRELLLIAELDKTLPRTDAVRLLTVALESVVENYNTYQDYNRTTTQSDQGQLFYVFVDFLRLRADYDRIAWNLKPALLAHDVLINEKRIQAADMWRQLLVQQTRQIANKLQARLDEKCQKYGTSIATIGDRLAESFVRPLDIHRLTTLVPPAIHKRNMDQGETAFKQLAESVEVLISETAKAKLLEPEWLIAVERKVNMAEDPLLSSERTSNLTSTVPPIRLTWKELQRQLHDDL